MGNLFPKPPSIGDGVSIGWPDNFRCQYGGEKLNKLIAEVEHVFDGVEDETNIENIPVSFGEILIFCYNDTGEKLTVSLEVETSEDEFSSYYSADGDPVGFEIDAGSSGVFGVFQKWPRMLGGRLKIAADAVPDDGAELVVKVWEV